MKISDEAVRAAEAMCGYCTTRFPTDSPPHPMLDRPWFAEKVQQAIDAATATLRGEVAMLQASCEEHVRRRNESGEFMLRVAARGGDWSYADLLANVADHLGMTVSDLQKQLNGDE